MPENRAAGWNWSRCAWQTAICENLHRWARKINYENDHGEESLFTYLIFKLDRMTSCRRHIACLSVEYFNSCCISDGATQDGRWNRWRVAKVNTSCWDVHSVITACCSALDGTPRGAVGKISWTNRENVPQLKSFLFWQSILYILRQEIMHSTSYKRKTGFISDETHRCDSVNSTNRMECDLFNSTCGSKSDTGLRFSIV